MFTDSDNFKFQRIFNHLLIFFYIFQRIKFLLKPEFSLAQMSPVKEKAVELTGFHVASRI
jgi:hypothetical protein